MAEFPALPLWTDAYLGDTTHLTTIEHGAYLLLLIVAWRSSDCALPDDDRLLARYTRLEARQWKRIRPILAEFFIIEDGKWRQSRLVDEREAVRTYREKLSAKGKAGAAAKALKTKGRHKAGVKPGQISAEAQVKQDASSLLLQKDIDKSISKKSLIPEDWIPPQIDELPPRARVLAEQWPADIYANEGEAFVCYWRSERKMKADWRMTWANRVIDQHDRVMRRLKPAAGGSSQPSADTSFLDWKLEQRRLDEQRAAAGGTTR